MKASPAKPTASDAQRLQTAIHAQGDYDHVVIAVQRGHLHVSSGDVVVARLAPLPGGHYGLSFQNHQGRWEPMPFAGPLDDMAATIVQTLAPYLERWDLSRGISGSDH